jgi:hypothetical protein
MVLLLVWFCPVIGALEDADTGGLAKWAVTGRLSSVALPE